MNLLESIKAQREKLDAKVNAAIAERDQFIESISETLGQNSHTRQRRMSAAGRKRISEAAKKRWAAAKK
jgi:hypothetical protein